MKTSNYTGGKRERHLSNSTLDALKKKHWKLTVQIEMVII